MCFKGGPVLLDLQGRPWDFDAPLDGQCLKTSLGGELKFLLNFMKG